MNGDCCLVHNKRDTHSVVQYVHEIQVSTPLINTISSAAACSRVHLSKPFDSQTNWLSSAETWCSGIPVTRPPLPCALLRAAVVPRVLRVVPIYSRFHSRDGVWQIPWLPPFGLPLVCLSLCDWRPQSTCEGTQTKHKRQKTCELHSRTNAMLQLYVMCWSLEKKNRGVGRQGAFSNKILGWMSIHFKERNKKRHWAMFHGDFTQRLQHLYLPTSKEQETP